MHTTSLLSPTMDTRSLLEQLEGRLDGAEDEEPWLVTADRDLHGAAASMHAATEALIVQRQRTQLRRFETMSSDAVEILDGGIEAARELAGTRTGLQAQARVLELEAEAKGLRLQAQAQARRAAHVEAQLRELRRAREPLAAPAPAAAVTDATAAAVAPPPSSPPPPSPTQPPPVAPPAADAGGSCREVVESIRAARLASSDELSGLVGRALASLSLDLYSGAGNPDPNTNPNPDLNPDPLPRSLLGCRQAAGRADSGVWP